MFSGSCAGAGGFPADTWLWKDGDWANVTHLGGGVAPPGRSLAAMAASGDGVVLFGGYTPIDHSSNDTWLWDPTTGWKDISHTLAQAPAGRSYHTMQAIEAGVLLFGGTARTDEQHDTAIGDTWLFSEATKTWSNLDLESGAAAPYPRCVRQHLSIRA